MMEVDSTPVEVQQKAPAVDEPPHPLTQAWDALQAQKAQPQALIQGYRNILASDLQDEQAVKIKEQCISSLGEVYCELGLSTELNQLLRDVRPFFTYIPKAKTAKIVRKLFELVGHKNLGNSVDQQIALCEESIAWSRQEKRTFLRHRLQTRLAELYFQKQAFHPALSTLKALLREVRRLDDKQLLVEELLLESKIYHALKNLSKAKAALVGSRTAANSVYCPPLQQASLDLMSGILHAEEKDFKTAFSYFYEAFETYHQYEAFGETAKHSLKYMLLCRIMSDNVEDVKSILSTKNVLRYTGREVDAMKATALAYKSRDLHEFEKIQAQFHNELAADPIVASHLTSLYDSMLEHHLSRVIEPYSEVQITHIAKKIKLEPAVVEAKLSQMILDKKLHGTLDQANACLIVFEQNDVDDAYPAALQTVENFSRVVDALVGKWEGKFEKAAAAAAAAEKDKEKEKDKDKDKKKEAAAAEPSPTSSKDKDKSKK